MKKTVFFLVVSLVFLCAGISSGEMTGNVAVSTTDVSRDAGLPETMISLDLRDMDVVEVFKFIAAKAGLNIVPTKAVTGRVSFTADNVSVRDVFDIILRSNSLAYEKHGTIYNIMTEAEYKSLYGRNFYDARVFRVFRLQYAIPEQASNLLNTMKSDIGKVLLDSESGVILVIDTPDRVANMESALQAMEHKSVLRVFTLKYARAKEIEEQLKAQLDTKKVGSIKADERTNQVVVQTLPDRMEGIAKLIEGLDQKTRQILIDAKIVQVRLTNSNNAGVEWEGLFDVGNKYGKTYVGSYPVSAVGASTDDWRSRKQVLADTGYVGSYPFTGTTSEYAAGTVSTGTEEMHVGVVGKHDFDTVIKYLQTLGKTRVLSNPKLAVVNNQEARIHVGERQAYITTTTTQTQTSTTTSESVTYVDVGIQLMVTPTINDEGFVTVKIKPEISSVPSFLTTANGNRIPIIDTSTAETIVMVKDGTSILIGGLSKEDKRSEDTGTPFLSKIPLIGAAFKTSTNSSTRTEMIVMLTPHVISGDELVTGYQRDLGVKLDKEYQGYQQFSDDPAQLNMKQYQSYPQFREEAVPEMKPAKSF